jgi:hypothetical protein
MGRMLSLTGDLESAVWKFLLAQVQTEPLRERIWVVQCTCTGASRTYRSTKLRDHRWVG